MTKIEIVAGDTYLNFEAEDTLKIIIRKRFDNIELEILEDDTHCFFYSSYAVPDIDVLVQNGESKATCPVPSTTTTSVNCVEVW